MPWRETSPMTKRSVTYFAGLICHLCARLLMCSPLYGCRRWCVPRALELGTEFTKPRFREDLRNVEGVAEGIVALKQHLFTAVRMEVCTDLCNWAGVGMPGKSSEEGRGRRKSHRRLARPNGPECRPKCRPESVFVKKRGQLRRMCTAFEKQYGVVGYEPREGPEERGRVSEVLGELPGWA